MPFPLSLSGQVRSLGPLAVEERSPLLALSYVPAGEVATVLDRGVSGVDFTIGYSNVFDRAERGRYAVYLDVERMNSSLRYRQGLGHGLEVGGELGLQTNWGGVFDPVIQGLHDVFGLPNGDRDKEPKGQTGLELRKDGRLVFDGPITRLGLARVQGFLKWQLYTSTSSVLAARMAVKLPVGDQDTHSGHTDVAFEALAQTSWGPWFLHAMLGWTSARPPEWASEIGRPGARLGMLAVERRLGGVSLLAQVATSDAYIGGTGVRELDSRPSLFAVGVRGRRGEWGWDLGFVEDVPANSPSVDFTVSLRLHRMWP